MAPTTRLFKVERDSNVLILTPLDNLGEFAMEDHREETEEILATCEQSEVAAVLIDLQRTSYLQSTALGFLEALRRKLCRKQVVLCGLSRQEEEVLEITHLNERWAVYSSRDEALAALNQRD